MLGQGYRTALKLFEKYFWVFFGLAALTLAFYCFRCLDVQYVDSWDEARHGVNAYEMIQNGDYIQHTYNYEVDDWNLKPSISYWGILLGFRLFGYSVLGLRFCSALAYFLTGILTALFAKRYSKEASILVLGFFCANERPLSAHLARSGDADALYMLFFTIAILAMLRLKENHRNLFLCGLAFSLAFLTKSWHAAMIAAVGGLYLLGTRELFQIRLKEWGGFLLSIFAPLLLWFGWRYTKDGFWFLKKMIEVDLLARTGSANFEGHSYPLTFYYDYVFGAQGFIYRWLLLIVLAGIGIGLLWMWKRRAWNPAALKDGYGMLLWFLVPFVGFSLISTKLIWYCYPCTVPLFLGAAIFMGRVLRLPLEVPADAKQPAPKWRREVFGGLSWLVAAASVVLVAFYMRSAYLDVIRGAKGDAFQLFIQESMDWENSGEAAGETAYIYVTGENPENLGSWDQNMLFLAEITGDFHCADGGVEKFLEEESGVLYMERAYYPEYAERLSETGATILYENGSYLLLEKSGDTMSGSGKTET